jgi:hypothetical protein
VYGTGLGSGKNVIASLGQLKLTVAYAGTFFGGVDINNIQIPQDGAGLGPQTLSISVDGNPATTVRLLN